MREGGQWQKDLLYLCTFNACMESLGVNGPGEVFHHKGEIMNVRGMFKTTYDLQSLTFLCSLIIALKRALNHFHRSSCNLVELNNQKSISHTP